MQQADEDPDGRRTAPAALRNVDPLIDVLHQRLPDQGRVLEIASGTGQHVVAFAQTFSNLDWTPSDVDAGQRDSINAWRAQANLHNVEPPLTLDIADPWPVSPASVEAVLTINLFHLVPTEHAARFFEAARSVLTKDGRVIVYGPFLRGTDFASDGDRSFDASLRARDPAIGYKSVEVVTDMALANGFHPLAQDAMPANNLLLTFTKT